MASVAARRPTAEELIIAKHTQVIFPRFMALVFDGGILVVFLGILNNVFGSLSITNSMIWDGNLTIPWASFMSAILA